jgi:hypothetical protein
MAMETRERVGRKTCGLTDAEIEAALQEIDATVDENHPIGAQDGYEGFFKALGAAEALHRKSPDFLQTLRVNGGQN